MGANMLRADVHRYTGRSDIMSFLKLLLLNRCFRPTVTMRLYHKIGTGPLGRIAFPFLWVVHRFLLRRAGMDFPMQTDIGPGIMVAHGWGLVLTEGARLGRNVTLFHGVTIGRGDRIAADGTRTSLFPVIEDDVWVGPKATIVGGVTIGAGSRIMANSVVTRDVPPRSMVVGNPGEIVREECMPDVPNRVAFAADAVQPAPREAKAA